VSKRHQSSRRRSYGRRQHELRERTERQHEPTALDFQGDPADHERDGYGFLDLDLSGRRLRFAVGD
jgi:hypothetical protein